MMKERFAKLLLGEDMSGGGKGVSTALAISNAITNLSGETRFLRSPSLHCVIVIVYVLQISYCVWGAMEVGAPGAAEERDVAEGDGMATKRE